MADAEALEQITTLLTYNQHPGNKAHGTVMVASLHAILAKAQQRTDKNVVAKSQITFVAEHGDLVLHSR
jgi:hypothetical protein